jgi:diguanylate cyclase (GGDEF)-like protein
MEAAERPPSRLWLYFSIAAVLVAAAGVSAISARDPDGVWLRVGMVLITVGVAMWLPWPALVPAVLGIWLVPNFLRGTLTEDLSFPTETLLELPGLVSLAVAAVVARHLLSSLETLGVYYGTATASEAVVDPETGVYRQEALFEAIDSEVARSRRFNREFALVLAGVSELSHRFDYRERAAWEEAFRATAQLLLGTRHKIDRAFRWGDAGFALLLPESGRREVEGLMRRLSREARRARPAEGEPGGPLPLSFGVTFFPHCAGSVDDLLRRAEVALRTAERTSSRAVYDSAEAPELPAPETLRRGEAEAPDTPAVAIVTPATAPPASAAPLAPQQAAAYAAPGAAQLQPLAPASPPPGAPVHVLRPPPTAEAAAIDEALAELLAHLNQTVDLIRTLKGESAA